MPLPPQGNVKFHTANIIDSEEGGGPSAGTDLRTVTLADGTRIGDVHAIVNATGNRTVWPFLSSQQGLSEHCTKDRYR